MMLITERLLLREFNENDWQAVFEYQSDPLYLQYYPWIDRTEEAARSFVQNFINWQHEQPRLKYQFALILKSEDLLIGNCGIRKKVSNPFEAEIGYEIATPYWKQGLA